MIKKIRKILAIPFLLMVMICYFLSDIFQWLFDYLGNIFQFISLIIEGIDRRDGELYDKDFEPEDNIKY